MGKLLWRIALVTALVAASEIVALTAVAAPLSRTEEVVPSPTTGVVKSAVRLHSPLPDEIGPRPADCDDNMYLRYRSADGPAKSADADKIVSLTPGVFGGATMLEPLAVQVVDRAAAAGQHIEVWVHSRRSVCVYDRTGLDRAFAAKDPKIAIDYYFGDHSDFAGWPTEQQLAFLEADGYQQQLTDWRDAIIEGVPDPAARQSKVFCGGHSMGGRTVSALTSWEFGTAENPAPGYELCAGLIGLDFTVTGDSGGLRGRPGLSAISDLLYYLTHGIAKLGIMPTFNGPVLRGLVADTITVLRIVALAAYVAPDAESHFLRDLPRTLNTDIITRLMLARTYHQAVTNDPDVRSFRYTNAALLGAILDNNSSPLSSSQISMGSFIGPVGLKELLIPESIGNIPGTDIPIPEIGKVLTNSVGGINKVGPVDPDVLYRWRDYQQPAEPDEDGRVYSTPDTEFVDLRTVARLVFDGPGDFLDPFMPMVQVTDNTFEIGGSAGALANAKYPDGPGRLPQMFVFAPDGAVDPALNLLTKMLQQLNPEAPPLRNPVATEAPGYTHVDVLMAAPAQNYGGPPIPVVAVTDFITK